MAQQIDSSGWTGREKIERIGTLTAVGMLGIAICLDGIQDIALFLEPIPLAGPALQIIISWYASFLAVVIFGLWFALRGVNYFSGKNAGKKVLIMLSSVIVELVPIVDALPAITAGVIGIIIQTRIEDRGMSGLGIKETIVGAGKVAGAFGFKGAEIASKGAAALAPTAKTGAARAPQEQQGQFLDLRSLNQPTKKDQASRPSVPANDNAAQRKAA